MKLNRNSKKWVELYNQKLKELVDKKSMITLQSRIETVLVEVEDPDKPVYEDRMVNWLFFFSKQSRVHVGYKTKTIEKKQYVNKVVDAMPDRIKEAEEYADRLFSAMR